MTKLWEILLSKTQIVGEEIGRISNALDLSPLSQSGLRKRIPRLSQYYCRLALENLIRRGCGWRTLYVPYFGKSQHCNQTQSALNVAHSHMCGVVFLGKIPDFFLYPSRQGGERGRCAYGWLKQSQTSSMNINVKSAGYTRQQGCQRG